jgi:hypothetical protein
VQQSELFLKGLSDKAMATQIMPLKAQLKNAIAKASQERRKQLSDQLEKHSTESLAEFDKILKQAKDSMQAAAKDVGDMKATFEAQGKGNADKFIAELTTHYDKKLDDFKQGLKAEDDARKNTTESPEARLLKRAQQVRDSGLAEIKASAEALDAENRKQTDELLTAWQVQSDATCQKKLSEISAEINQFKARRQEALAKLEEILKKHTDNAESIAAEFIQ